MSNTVKVEKHLDFRHGVASHRQNVEGPMNQKKIVICDYFTGIALDTTNVWATSVPGTSDTIAISEVEGGSVLMTTGTGDDDSCMIASAIILSGTKKAICEVDLTITDVSGTAVFVGFSDAKSESNNSIAIHYAADSLTTVATDAVGFVIDADHSTSSVMCEGVQNGTDATSVDTGIDWADGERKKMRIELDSTTAYFYIGKADGTDPVDSIGYVASAVTAATLLCVTVQAMTRANDAANTVRIHSIKVWQDE